MQRAGEFQAGGSGAGEAGALFLLTRFCPTAEWRWTGSHRLRAIVNLHPGSGDPGEYRTVSRTPHGEVEIEHALISVYPGLSPGTRLMTLDSSSTEGTLAAAEFVTRADTVRQLVTHGVPLEPAGRVGPAFHVVIGGLQGRSADQPLPRLTRFDS